MEEIRRCKRSSAAAAVVEEKVGGIVERCSDKVWQHGVRAPARKETEGSRRRRKTIGCWVAGSLRLLNLYVTTCL